MPTVASRIVAEIYRGIDFPAGWAQKPNYLNLGMARDILVSVAAMFDAEQQPIALCWRIRDGEEKFACVSSDKPDGNSLIGTLNDELTRESRWFGTEDLLGTLLWAPDELRPNQGQAIHRIAFVRGRYRNLTGWNVAPQVMVSRAGQLLMTTRAVDDRLAFPMPASLEEMHQHMGNSSPRLITVLPGSVAIQTEAHVGRKLVTFFVLLIVAGTLISTWLLNHG